ncbi:hypothetical protein PCASD_02558 [Puccinia coronata f. sp. avenae]|uniref:TEA domain-containing protein n=1 Tax=Puccinia coronata f. sp. avenae TaxID=200324 RepID=A0A2N5VBI3_9BASI|nr:hypothetical protein PCASD_02558 [Puccinia coronata f. sp. avenae]
MTSYDFFAPCSTPKRQRTSSERERLVSLPIEGPSRRKTPAYLDLNGCDFLSMISDLPFESPTIRQCTSTKEARLAPDFPNFNIQALVPQTNFDENFRSHVEFGDNSVAEGVMRPLQITHANIENVNIPYNLGPLDYHLDSVQQVTTPCASNLIRAEPFVNRNQSYFIEETWRDDTVPKMNSESSSYSSLPSLVSSSDCDGMGDFNSSVDAFASTPSYNPSQTPRENIQLVIEHPVTTCQMNSGLDIMNSGSNTLENDMKNLFNVPMMSLHVTSNLCEAQNIINVIRCEASKRQLYSKDRDIWSEEASRAFNEAIRVIPRLGRAKILALTQEGRKPFGRNELIADYIYRRTGIVRHRKQVSSHIQVIKNSKKLEPYSGPELLDSTNSAQNASFDQCSASWFGGYMSKDVLILYPCTPEFPFPSQILQHQAPPQDEMEYLAFLAEVSRARNSKHLA